MSPSNIFEFWKVKIQIDSKEFKTENSLKRMKSVEGDEEILWSNGHLK